MMLHRLPDGSVHVAHLDEWHLQMLRSIPVLASAGDDDQAKRRLFPPPYSHGDAGEEHFQDWDEFVRPGLEQLFTDSLQHVAEDLESVLLEAPAVPKTPEKPESAAAIDPPAPRRKRRKSGPGISPPDPDLWGFHIPAAHVEDWYRAMNQVRLMLSEKYEAHRTDNEHIAGMFISGNMETLIQYELFTGLCSWWVEALLRP